MAATSADPLDLLLTRASEAAPPGPVADWLALMLADGEPAAGEVGTAAADREPVAAMR